MGLIVETYIAGTTELENVYVSLDKGSTQINGNGKVYCKVNVYSSVDDRAKERNIIKRDAHTFFFSQDDMASVPIWKLVYARLKEIYGNTKDLDIPKCSVPVITKTEISKDEESVIFTGTKAKSNSILSESGIEIIDNGKDFSITIPKRKAIIGDKIYCQSEGCYDSDFVKAKYYPQSEKSPK